MRNDIYIKGAREHNLKDIDVSIPRDKLVVITGLSGSGKSSLAFDTIYAEGQRRYVESLSSYARQFLGQMDKPDLDYIDGLSPAISIDQKTTGHNPRSTVGTVTEIYDYIRLLYARVGVPHCPNCGKVIEQQTVDQIVDSIMLLPKGTKIQLLAPVIRGRKGEYVKLLSEIKKSGYVRVRVDGIMYEIDEEIKMDKNKIHTIDIIVDRLIIKDDIEKRLTDSVETVLNLSSGLVIVDVVDDKEILYSQNYSCPDCDISIGEISPRMFSFNNPYGACPTCAGLGTLNKLDENYVIPDDSKSLLDGAIAANSFNLTKEDSYSRAYFDGLAEHYNFDLDTPFNKLPRKIKNIILYGTKGEKIKFKYKSSNSEKSYNAEFEGVMNIIERRYQETSTESTKKYYESFMRNMDCPDCNGARLKRESLAITVGDLNIYEITNLSMSELIEFLKELNLSDNERFIADQILKEINSRLQFLLDVGLDYLTLGRKSSTLSGGEAQRIRLATQIGSGLMGVLYILDEPSIGLHQKDNERLLKTLKHLRDLGNTVLVVEHDEETMREADYIIDMGPGAGEHGGYVIAQGTYDDIVNNEDSITGQYLSGAKKIEIPKKRRKPDNGYIQILKASENNLKNVNINIPIGLFTCVTGVSGSGKSTLVNDILYKSFMLKLHNSKVKPGANAGILGTEKIDKVISIDQSPIGRTPRSNPATYTGVFDHIRDLFASTNEAKARGYKKGRFSFNVKGGRCESCAGDGIIKIEMHFLPDVYVPCEVCHGKRYNRETLEVKYKDKNIADVLDMTIEEAYKFFENLPSIQKKFKTLLDVGLGYIRVGQPSTTLSGGEAQRIKLATELSKVSTGKTLYILDEPTTGLHVDDVRRLVDIIKRLVDNGNTIVVIEHNLDVIKTADYIIDLGPNGGKNGGELVAYGTPEEVSNNENSYTGKYLKWVLNNG